MNATQFWSFVSHTVMVLLLAAGVSLLAFPFVFVVPKVADVLSQTGTPVPQSLRNAIDWAQLLANWWPLCLLLLALAWGIFEWKCSVQYKAFIRLSVLGLLSLVTVLLTCYAWVVTIVPVVSVVASTGAKMR